MGNKETLRQYLTYNKETNEIEQIFYNLDNQLKYLHSQGYYVGKLNSDTILLETNRNSLQNGQTLFMFSTIAKSKNIDKDISNNIIELSKLAIGAFISRENGFSDYSGLDASYLRKYFDEMAFYIPNSEYYRNVIIDNDTTMYYSDFVNSKISEGKNNSRQMIKSNNYGKMYVQDEEAAFIKIIFYPILIITVITFIAIFSKFF